ncbi:MAG: stage sporulation protein [Firmicutes bacterium]|nr:stage sporulation protein [Bacillota bacterium]
MVTRRQRIQRERRIWWITGVVIAFFVLAVSRLHYNAVNEAAIPAVTPVAGTEAGAVSILPGWRYVLSLGIPGFAQAAASQTAVKVKPELTARAIIESSLTSLTGVDVKDLGSIFRVEIPFLAIVKGNQATVSAMSLPDFPKFTWRDTVSSNKPLVGIYHTHTSESFIPWSGVSHAPGGKQGNIVEVGEALVNKLAEHGIGAVQSKSIHDYPSFMKAYGPSEETAKNMLATNPSLEMLFDIHRDACKKEAATVTVNGMAAARITIIVAMGHEGLPQPHWQQNHAFAKLIDAKLNQHYPGVSKGIQLDEWRYNQHLHPRALLLEVGCQESEKEEVLRSMAMLGDILAEILAES